MVFSNTLCFQWGKYITTTVWGYTTIVFPMAFRSALCSWSVVYNTDNRAMSDGWSYSTSLTPTQMIVGYDRFGCTWLVFGTI